MSEIARLSGSLSRSSTRQIDRARARVIQRTETELAEVARIGIVQAGRIEAARVVGECALRNAAHLSAIETEYANLVPEAAGRLRAIGDATALTMIGIVSDTGGRIPLMLWMLFIATIVIAIVAVVAIAVSHVLLVEKQRTADQDALIALERLQQLSSTAQQAMGDEIMRTRLRSR